jgi:hypothetical protein
LNITISGDDRKFRMQFDNTFDLCGKLQPVFLFQELGIKKIEECFLQGNRDNVFCPSVIYELLMSFSEQETRNFL